MIKTLRETNVLKYLVYQQAIKREGTVPTPVGKGANSEADAAEKRLA